MIVWARSIMGHGFKSLFIGILCAAGVAAIAMPALRAQTTDLVVRSAFRVCADPANLPFSNKDREGYENKIADLFADQLGVPVLYTWYPQATGFIRNTLRLKKCDVVMGASQGHELVLNTNPYFRSVYVLVHKADSPLEGIDNLGDPRLKDKKIGVVAGTPPATVLAVNDLISNVRPYQLVVDTRHDAPGKQMVEDIAAGKIDVGLVWGPIGGYYAKKSDVPLTVVPLTKETDARMTYRITMGVRRGEKDWKHQLNKLIRTNQDEINKILIGFGIPILDEQDRMITLAGK